MEKDRVTNILSILNFGSLEEFAEGMRWDAKDNVVRVEGVIRKEPNRAIGDHWVHYLVVVTALMRDGNTAACLLEVGGCWDFDRRHGQSHHSRNLDRALEMVRDYLAGQGFTVAPGIWNSRAMLENGFLASTNLWSFQGNELVPVDGQGREEVA